MNISLTEMENTTETNPFEPINEKVYKHLYNAIITLKYAPGTKLNESKIATELNVSRTPVRIAIQRLYRENLVEYTNGKNPCVTKIRFNDCCDLVDARRCIEGYAAYYAARQISEEELLRMKEIILKFKHLGTEPDTEEFLKSYNEFHQLVVCASHNKYLIESYSLIQGDFLRQLWYVKDKTNLKSLNVYENVYENHLPVYYALKNHCSSLARDEIMVSIDRNLYLLGFFMQ